MRRYLLKCLALFLALAASFAALFGVAQSLPAQYTGSIMGTIAHKVELLQATPSPRVILAGGSSSPYATNCEMIGEALQLPCINIGATAYLGIEFYLSMLERTLQPGDVIVIAPEHSMLAGVRDYKTVWAAVENHRAVWDVVPTGYWPAMALHYWDYAKTKWELSRGEAPAPYHADFGPLGDVTTYRETLLEVGYIRDDLIDLGPHTLKARTVHALNRFYEKATAQGAQVYFVYAPLNRLAVTSPPQDWAALESALHEKLALPILGRMQDAMMDGAYFYDSNNHLTTEGARLYSAHLIGLLEEAMDA
ncbi:MAG: hypothetical protein AB7V55_02285 [Oscillospiraceae bacterium]